MPRFLPSGRRFQRRKEAAPCQLPVARIVGRRVSTAPPEVLGETASACLLLQSDKLLLQCFIWKLSCHRLVCL